MGDEFNIEKVENLYSILQPLEISDISKIIKKMICIKNDSSRKKQKRTKPYDVIDKIELNGFSDNNGEKIKKHHIDSFHIVDEAIICLEEYEVSIREDLYDYYWETYVDVLTEMELSIKDMHSIKKNANKIYSQLTNKIYEDIFNGKKSDIETNKRITYLHAITAYVFYQCKFLIPVEYVIKNVV